MSTQNLGDLDPSFVDVDEGGDVIRRTKWNPELPSHPDDPQKGDVVEVGLERSPLLLEVTGFGEKLDGKEARYAYGRVSWEPFVEKVLDNVPEGFEWSEEVRQKLETKMRTKDFVCDLHDLEVKRVMEMLEKRL